MNTFVLGIDGLPCWMWRQFADTGVMPFSKGLLDSGTLVPMASSAPEVSSSAWASIVTGENPGGHNVYGFTDLIDSSYMLGFTSSRTFKSRPFWQRNEGERHLVMNVPQTYPAQPLPGTLVSGFVALDLERAVFPADQFARLDELGYQVDADMSTIETSKDAFLKCLHDVLALRVSALEHYLQQEAWDSVMFVITGTDRLNHYLWEDFEDTASPYHQRFLEFYREVDRVIERIVGRLDDSTTLIAVSDHGFARQQVSVNVNYLLREAGYLSTRPSHRTSYIDMLPETRAFAMDPGRIYLHRQGRYPNGRLTEDEALEVEAELIRWFTSLEVEGHKLVDRVLLGREIYHGPYAHRAPDLVLMAAEDVALSGRMNLDTLLEPTPINGKHTFENSSFFYRGAADVRIPQRMRVEDVLGVLNQAKQRRQAA